MEQVPLGFGQIGYLRSALNSGRDLVDTKHCLTFELALGCAPVTVDRVVGWLHTLVEVHPMLGAILLRDGDDYSWCSSGGADVPLRQIARDENWLQAPLDPAGSLWRARLFERPEVGQNVLQLAVHHLVADSEACEILSRDLQAIIDGDCGDLTPDGVWDFVQVERERWTEAHASRTIEHWRRAAQRQVIPFSPAGGLRHQMIHGQADRRLTSADVTRAITQTRAWQDDRAPIIVAASNRWLRGGRNVVTSLVQPGVLVVDGSGADTHEEAVLDSVRHAWFNPADVQAVLPPGLMGSGDGFTYATNLIAQAGDSAQVRTLPKLVSEESPASQQFENYVVIQQFEDDYTLIHLVMSGAEDRMAVEEISVLLNID